MDEDLNMWSYWREKYDVLYAAEHYFPETFKNDPVLTQALAQMRIAELAIEARIAELHGATPTR